MICKPLSIGELDNYKFKVQSVCIATAMNKEASLETGSEDSFDELIENAPDTIFDSRSYYWPNFDSPEYTQ